MKSFFYYPHNIPQEGPKNDEFVPRMRVLSNVHVVNHSDILRGYAVK
jgi:hypothetical protein